MIYAAEYVFKAGDCDKFSTEALELRRDNGSCNRTHVTPGGCTLVITETAT